MPSQSPHPDTTPFIRNVRNLANRQNQTKHGPLGNSQHPPPRGRISVPAGERDFSKGWSSVGSKIQGQNSTLSSWLTNSCIADITRHLTSTPSETQRQSINTLSGTPGTSSCSTAAPWGTWQTDSMSYIVSSSASGSACTPTPLSGTENLPTPIAIQKPKQSLPIHREHELE